MSPFFVIGGASVGAFGLGVVLAGGLDHLVWRLGEGRRRRRARRRGGQVGSGARQIEVRIVGDASQLHRSLRLAERELARIGRLHIRVERR